MRDDGRFERCSCCLHRNIISCRCLLGFGQWEILVSEPILEKTNRYGAIEVV